MNDLLEKYVGSEQGSVSASKFALHDCSFCHFTIKKLIILLSWYENVTDLPRPQLSSQWCCFFEWQVYKLENGAEG